MNKNYSLFRVLWWGFFAIIIDAFTVWSVYVGQVSKFRIIMAVVMTAGLIYMIVQYKAGRSPAGKR